MASPVAKEQLFVLFLISVVACCGVVGTPREMNQKFLSPYSWRAVKITVSMRFQQDLSAQLADGCSLCSHDAALYGAMTEPLTL